MKKEDLEKVIEARIEDLEKYNFLTDKNRYKESHKGEIQYISLDQVTALIKSLRETRIKIYKTLLEDFRNNKKKYNNYMKRILKEFK